jgi:hypothetical protein
MRNAELCEIHSLSLGEHPGDAAGDGTGNDGKRLVAASHTASSGRGDDLRGGESGLRRLGLWWIRLG